MRCPSCGCALMEAPKVYQCSSCSFTLPREIAGKTLPPDLVRRLIVEGRTPVLQGFRSKSGKPFAAALVLKDGRVMFDFPQKNHGENPNSNATFIRVESERSGSTSIAIRGAVGGSFVVDFGLVPSRLAECLGLIAAAKFLLYEVKNPAGLDVNHPSLK